MEAVMDDIIIKYLHAIDPVTSRKRLLAFMADKVTELHRTGDAVALMLMAEEGELQTGFVDYLLVTSHTREGLMRKIYDKTFKKKPRLLRLRTNTVRTEHRTLHRSFNVRTTFITNTEILIGLPSLW